MMNSYFIGAYWAARPEPLQGAKHKIIETLNILAELDDQFFQWYEKGSSRKEAIGKKVVLDNDIVERLCLKKVKRNELDEGGFSKMGFYFSLWSGHRKDETSSISFNVGTQSKWLTNSCVISIPLIGPARERLLLTKNAKKIIEALVEIWNPDYAYLTSHDVSDRFDGIGFVNYRKFIKRTPTTNSYVHYVKGTGGHWFSIKTENIDEIALGHLMLLKDII